MRQKENAMAHVDSTQDETTKRKRKGKKAQGRIHPVDDSVVADQSPPGTRLLSKRDILQRINRADATIWKWMQQGLFPRAKDVKGRPYWVEAEIEAWIRGLPIARIKGDPQ